MIYTESVEADDWRARRDAEIMQEYQAIKSDPQRARKARSVIERSVMEGKQVLKDAPVPSPGRRNPATIGPLKVRRF